MAIIREGLSYDDVLLEPVYSAVPHRDEENVDLHVGFYSSGGSESIFDHPIVPANMQDVAGLELLKRQVESGGLALMHRFQSVDEQIATFKALGMEANIGASIGVQEDDVKAARRFVDEGIDIICVDAAHGDHYLVARTVQLLKRMTMRPTIIAGNVATKGAAKRLWDAGADIVKVGVGPGSLCTTRIETGCGVPQLTAIMDVAEMRREHYPHCGIIADGGIKNAGDCVKALCFADMVMVGNLFAGTDEAPGEIVNELEAERNHRKLYRGSSTHKASHVEGVQAWVKPSGSFDKVLERLLEGIRSGCSYQGSHNLNQLKEDPHLVRITSAGLRESYPHDVVVVREEG